ncbi:MAG: maleylacetoacetate isomerase [Gammaproteobacteria bacterium]|nr:maleylacetoacetate isomerase [Gammaproteobacteria bacterium]
MKLYSYYRSSAAYRVRIALNLKGIDYEQVAVNLLNEEEMSDDYAAVNPQNMVPVLEHDGQLFFQSMAILEYLEELYPDTALLPEDTVSRARVRALANIVACDIHPLNNLRMLKYLGKNFDADAEQKNQWYRYWIELGFSAFEVQLKGRSNGLFCEGEKAGMADALLIPQVYNARRFDVDMTAYPLISSIELHCLTLDPFKQAIPENQPDAK